MMTAAVKLVKDDVISTGTVLMVRNMGRYVLVKCTNGATRLLTCSQRVDVS